jgi:hypothetical protein
MLVQRPKVHYTVEYTVHCVQYIVRREILFIELDEKDRIHIQICFIMHLQYIWLFG